MCNLTVALLWRVDQAEMHKMDIDTRKLMTMHGAFSVNGDVDRLYLSRKKGVRGLISVKFAIEHGSIYNQMTWNICKLGSPSLSMGSSFERLRTMFELKCSGCSCDLVMSVRNIWNFIHCPRTGIVN